MRPVGNIVFNALYVYVDGMGLRSTPPISRCRFHADGILRAAGDGKFDSLYIQHWEAVEKIPKVCAAAAGNLSASTSGIGPPILTIDFFVLYIFFMIV